MTTSTEEPQVSDSIFEESSPSQPQDNNHNNLTPQTKIERQEKPPASEWKRSTNYEEAMPFICNIFYFFYFPYVCRIAPLMEEDIPQIAEADKGRDMTTKLSNNWTPLFNQYISDLDEYHKQVKASPKFFFQPVYILTRL